MESPESQEVSHTCAGCRIELEPVASIGRTEDSQLINWVGLQDLALLSTGEYLTSSSYGGAHLLRYDAAGAFQGEIGKEGSGPGEFMDGTAEIRTLDSLVFVADSDLRRMSVYSLDREYRDSFQLPGNVFDFIPLRGDSFVVAGPVAVGGEVRPLHVINHAGEVVRSFGTIGYGPRSTERILGSADFDSFWSIAIDSRTVERYSTDGKLEYGIDIDVPWWWSWEGRDWELGHDSVPTDPMPTSLVDGGDGLLWIAVATADSQWPTNWDDQSGSPQSIFDTRILVVDISTRQVIAETSSDALVIPVHGSQSLLATVRSNSDGVAEIEVMRPRLMRPSN